MRLERLPQRPSPAPRELLDRVGAGVEIAFANRTPERRHKLGAVTQVIVGGRIADEAGDECRVIDGSCLDAPPAELAIERCEPSGV